MFKPLKIENEQTPLFYCSI